MYNNTHTHKHTSDSPGCVFKRALNILVKLAPLSSVLKVFPTLQLAIKNLLSMRMKMKTRVDRLPKAFQDELYWTGPRVAFIYIT